MKKERKGKKKNCMQYDHYYKVETFSLLIESTLITPLKFISTQKPKISNACNTPFVRVKLGANLKVTWNRKTISGEQDGIVGAAT